MTAGNEPETGSRRRCKVEISAPHNAVLLLSRLLRGRETRWCRRGDRSEERRGESSFVGGSGRVKAEAKGGWSGDSSRCSWAF